MLFKHSALRLTAFVAPLLATSIYAADAKLSLPNEATVGVEAVEELTFDSDQARLSEILLHPIQAADATHSLPEYCVIIGNAQLTDGRIRVTAQEVTCIETHGAESDIFSGEFSASAYGEDDRYGIACEGLPCTLSPGQTFLLTLNNRIEIERLENPSAELNRQRRGVNGEGVANPVPREQAVPD